MEKKLQNTKKTLEKNVNNNGIESYTQKELLIYLVDKIDRIETNLTTSVKKNCVKIGKLELTDKYFTIGLGFLYTIVVFIITSNILT